MGISQCLGFPSGSGSWYNLWFTDMFSAGVQHGEQFGLSKTWRSDIKKMGVDDTYSAVTHVLAVLWENMTLWNHGSRCTGKRAWINSRHLKANWSHFEKSILYRNNTNIESEQSRLLALLFSLKDEQPPDPSNLSIGGLYMQVFSINNGALRGGVMAIADVNSPDFGLISVLLECKGNRLKV